MKKIMLLGALLALATAFGAQSPVSNDAQELALALKDVQAQQLQIADNQEKIDAKLANLAEAIRVARIYASRGGGR